MNAGTRNLHRLLESRRWRKSRRLHLLFVKSITWRLVINLSYSKEKKEATGSELLKCATSRVARTIADKIEHQRSFAMPLLLGFIPRQPFVPKSDLIPKVHAVGNSEDGDSTAKAVSRPAPLVENETSARMNSCDQPAKRALGEFSKIHVLLKPDLLEDTEAYAKFVDGVSKVVSSSFFARRKAQS